MLQKMSFFNKFARSFQQAVHTIQHEVTHVANPFDEIKHIGDSIKGEVNHIGDSVKGEVNHIGDQVKGEVNHIGDQVKNEVNHIGDQVKGEVNHIGETVKGELQKAANDILDEMKTAFGKVEDAFTGDAIKKGIKKSIEIAKAYPVYPSEVDLILPGGITFAWGDIEGKIETLGKYVDSPPSGRDQILEFIEILAPTQLTIELTVDVELVVIGSSALTFGGAVVFTAEQVDTVIKHVLDDLGVQ